MAATFVRRQYQVLQQDLNGYGILHGGRLLTLADETCYLSAKRHAGAKCLTRAVHQASFHQPAHALDILILEAQVGLVGTSSLWVAIEVRLNDTHRPLIMDGIFVFAALDEQGKPRKIPPIRPETEMEKHLHARLKELRRRVLS